MLPMLEGGRQRSRIRRVGNNYSSSKSPSQEKTRCPIGPFAHLFAPSVMRGQQLILGLLRASQLIGFVAARGRVMRVSGGRNDAVQGARGGDGLRAQPSPARLGRNRSRRQTPPGDRPSHERSATADPWGLGTSDDHHCSTRAARPPCRTVCPRPHPQTPSCLRGPQSRIEG